MPNLRTRRPFVLKVSDLETNLDPSVTVPDETHTIREIMEKHVRGQKIMEEMSRRMQWSEKADFDDVDMEEAARMDLSDRENLAIQIRLEVDEKKAALKATEDALELRQKDAKEKADLRKQKNDQGPERSERPVESQTREEAQRPKKSGSKKAGADEGD